jgi:hypothetical protein
MTASNFEGRNPLDDQLDAALAKYAAVEPRIGLEARILANLKAQQHAASPIGWWRWAASLATALAIAGLLVWRLETRPLEQLVHNPANPELQAQRQVATTNPAANSTVAPQLRKSSVRLRKHSHARAVAKAPKLEQFPSPRPLTEQEKLLAEYVSRFQEEAVLVARARAELLRQDLEQMQHGTEADGEKIEHSK